MFSQHSNFIIDWVGIVNLGFYWMTVNKIKNLGKDHISLNRGKINESSIGCDPRSSSKRDYRDHSPGATVVYFSLTGLVSWLLIRACDEGRNRLNIYFRWIFKLYTSPL